MYSWNFLDNKHRCDESARCKFTWCYLELVMRFESCRKWLIRDNINSMDLFACTTQPKELHPFPFSSPSQPLWFAAAACACPVSSANQGCCYADEQYFVQRAQCAAEPDR
ncbi:hypothetical protein BaRGS_00007450 [Batillaria attramentaria]|uniref:Uncharacterized protein n=1 Tax=Batillaria attramentaria TaxID=370345 RepID=A0ABD0LPF1_9CAEN